MHRLLEQRKSTFWQELALYGTFALSRASGSVNNYTGGFTDKLDFSEQAALNFYKFDTFGHIDELKPSSDGIFGADLINAYIYMVKNGTIFTSLNGKMI